MISQTLDIKTFLFNVQINPCSIYIIKQLRACQFAVLNLFQTCSSPTSSFIRYSYKINSQLYLRSPLATVMYKQVNHLIVIAQLFRFSSEICLGMQSTVSTIISLYLDQGGWCCIIFGFSFSLWYRLELFVYINPLLLFQALIQVPPLFMYKHKSICSDEG